MSSDPHILESAATEDGLKRWRLRQRTNGFFFYEEETLQEEIYWVDADGGERDVAAESYWGVTHVSGLFDTRMGARADAFSTLRWLSEASTTFRTNGS